MSAGADSWGETIDLHLANQDEGWQLDLEELERTEQATDELRHNLYWKNVLHRMQNPNLYTSNT